MHPRAYPWRLVREYEGFMSYVRWRITSPILRSAIITGMFVGGTPGLPFWHGLLVRSAYNPVADLIESLLPGEFMANLWPASILIGGGLWGWLLERLHGFY